MNIAQCHLALIQGNDGCAVPAFVLLSRTKPIDCRMGAKILPNRLSQPPRTESVNYPDFPVTREEGTIEIAVQLIQRRLDTVTDEMELHRHFDILGLGRTQLDLWRLPGLLSIILSNWSQICQCAPYSFAMHRHFGGLFLDLFETPLPTQ
jgi:hypothetical protein